MCVLSRFYKGLFVLLIFGFICCKFYSFRRTVFVLNAIRTCFVACCLFAFDGILFSLLSGVEWYKHSWLYSVVVVDYIVLMNVDRIGMLLLLLVIASFGERIVPMYMT